MTQPVPPFPPERLASLRTDLTDFAQVLESRGLRTLADTAMILAAHTENEIVKTPPFAGIDQTA